MPRVALSAMNVATIASPATGLLVFNTASTGTSPNQVCPGTYQWNGLRWIRFNDGYSCETMDCSGTPINCPPTGTLTDYDGNVYPTVVIGTQEWMAQNLKVTHYRNGTAIPYVYDATTWYSSGTTGMRCYYGVSTSGGDTSSATSTKTVYGALYNWYAATDSRSLCPIGWKVPTDGDWTTLSNYLTSVTLTGGDIKECGVSPTAHWTSTNYGATNKTCFTALPGGYRYQWGVDMNKGNYGYWWSSTEDGTDYAWKRTLIYAGSAIYREGSSNYIYKIHGYSVRCLRE